MRSRSNVEWYETAGCRTATGEADRVVERLRKAIATGFRSRDAFRTEPALGSLRNRPDFRALLMDAAMPSEPFAPSH